MINILLHCENKEKAQQIKQLAKDMNLTFALIENSDVSRSIAEFLNNEKGNSKTTLPPFYVLPELLVIGGLSDGQLDLFLKKYREEKIESIPLKAIITPYNINWTFYQLVSELKKEHEMMNSIRK